MKLLGHTINELKTILTDLGQPKFRAAQVYDWLNKGVAIEDMANIPKALREKLAENYEAGYAEVIKKQVSRDGTVKYLFKLDENTMVESVLMSYKHGNTLCVSTQAGCAMGCIFCASTKGGKQRDLTAGDMLAQFIAANKEAGGGRSITNVVLMGSGEPLDNYENTVKFLKLLHDEKGFGISYRNISLSTCGIVPGMERFIEEEIPVTLCLSLHSPDDERRKKIMPGASKYAIMDVVEAARKYFDKTGRRVIIEYAMMDDINDSAEDAKGLVTLLKGLNCHVNIIPLNPGGQGKLTPSTKANMDNFMRILEQNHVSVTRRRTLGEDIDGACGQLRNRMKKE